MTLDANINSVTTAERPESGLLEAKFRCFCGRFKLPGKFQPSLDPISEEPEGGDEELQAGAKPSTIEATSGSSQ